MGTLIMVTQLLCGLSLLVFVHELGHFLAAKAFGMRVNKFYIFFDAWGKKLWSKQIGDTEYGIGWLPLGGYVQIAGMIDETQSAEDLSGEPEEWEFRAKPAWQRFIVMIGGIVMNVITGILIFAMFLNTFVKEYIPFSEINKDGIYAYQAAQDMGLQTGDKIVAINGNTPERFKEEINSTGVYLGGEITVDRAGKQLDFKAPKGFFKRMGEPFVGPMYETISINYVPDTSRAAKAGFKEGDKIIQIGNKKIDRYADMSDALKAVAGTQAPIIINRDNQNVTLQSNVYNTGKLGVGINSSPPYEAKSYTFGNGLVFGAKDGYELIVSQVISFGMMFRGDINVSESLSSPIGIARIYGAHWDWGRFWRITGILSFILAFMNILPIPALDGGHMVFLIIEMIIGRRLSDQFLERAQIFGFVLLMGLMIFAFGNDIYKIFK